MGLLQHAAAGILRDAGVIVNGFRLFDIQVRDPAVYRRVFLEGTLGFGEAYMDGQWDCDDLAELAARLVAVGAGKRRGFHGSLMAVAQLFQNAQSVMRSKRVAKRHYDLGNSLYEAMLDTRMTYTCGYWPKAASLNEAQEHKLDLVCRKLNLQRGQLVLDIGCGWGSFAAFAAERYGVRVVGVTISEEQAKLARERCRELPVEIRLLDYRELPRTYVSSNGFFDHVVSLGMFEHVGPQNYGTYMQVASRMLSKDGYFLLHTIGGVGGAFDPWMEKYIFPGGRLPSLEQIAGTVRGTFHIEDVHNFGPDYDRTLCAWWKNFETAWPRLRATGRYDERFYRMWRYYLLSCAGAFRARATQLYQVVLSHQGHQGAYRSVR